MPGSSDRDRDSSRSISRRDEVAEIPGYTRGGSQYNNYYYVNGEEGLGIPTVDSPLGTIKSRLARARKGLQDCLRQFKELLPGNMRHVGEVALE